MDLYIFEFLIINEEVMLCDFSISQVWRSTYKIN